MLPDPRQANPDFYAQMIAYVGRWVDEPALEHDDEYWENVAIDQQWIEEYEYHNPGCYEILPHAARP